MVRARWSVHSHARWQHMGLITGAGGSEVVTKLDQHIGLILYTHDLVVHVS